VESTVWQMGRAPMPTEAAVTALWSTSEHVTLSASPTFQDGHLVGWTAFGDLAPGRTHQPGESFLAFPLHNLRPGTTYRLTGTPYASTPAGPVAAGLGIVGLGYTAVDPATAGPIYPTPAVFTFTATSTTHLVMLTVGEPTTIPAGATGGTLTLGSALNPEFGQPNLSSITLTMIEQRMARGQDWFCQSIVYESTLVNHLDLAVNTVRGRWWVDRHGVTRFARGDGPTDEPVLTFSDQPDPGAVSYVAVEASEDTARVVNDVVLENHGRAFDEGTGSWVAENTRFSARDATSVATVGPRQAEVPTSIYSPPFADLALYGAGEDLARSYVAAYADVEHRISRIRVHVTPDLAEDLAALDVYTAVDATYQDATTEALVVNISHQITQTNWHTELHLIERT